MLFCSVSLMEEISYILIYACMWVASGRRNVVNYLIFKLFVTQTFAIKVILFWFFVSWIAVAPCLGLLGVTAI